MGPATLVERDIENGKKALQALDAEGLDVRSALWLFEREAGWKFVLAMPSLKEKGPLATYERVRKALTKSNVEMPLANVTLLSTGEGLPKSLRAAIKTNRKAIESIRFSHNRIGDTFIDDAWIYRSA